ncbi:MAG: Fur family transcriptional regulator [Kordiimonas sp.]
MTQATTSNINTATKIPAHASLETEPILTPNERKVYAKLIALGRSAGAYELLDALRHEGIRAIPTIYRALKGLQDKGCVQHLVSTKSYVAVENTQKARGPKLLLICDRCHKVTQLEEGGVLNMLTENVRQSGFAVQAEHLELIVKCLNCNTQGAAP